jgi:hypothetical protein
MPGCKARKKPSSPIDIDIGIAIEIAFGICRADFSTPIPIAMVIISTAC